MISDVTNHVKVVFFGTGKIGRSSLRYARYSGLKVDFFVDNNRSLWGEKVDGVPVCAPDVLLNGDKYSVIVTVGQEYYHEISNQLSQFGLREDQDFFLFRNVLPISDDRFGASSGVVDLAPGLISIKSESTNTLGISPDHSLVYRFICEEQTSNFLEIFNRCKNAGILGKYLVRTKKSECKLRDALCLEHEFIPLFTYAVEWSPKMFYDYTMFMVDFLNELDRVGLGLGDAHAFNVAFSKGKFVFFDFDALRMGRTHYYRIQEFINYHIVILLMMAKNLIPKAYLYLNNPDPSVMPSIKDISGYLSADEQKQYQSMEDSCRRLSLAGDIQSCCAVLKEYVSSIQLSQIWNSRWNGYQSELYDTQDESEWSDKQQAVVKMIRSVRPKTLLDLAGNMGWYEFVVRDEVERCIVADLDYNCVDFVYRYVVEHAIENVYPVYLNLVTPTPAYYKDTHIGDTAIIPWRKSAIERFKSEMVLALAVVHHLAFAQQLSFEEIIGQFALYTGKWLIVEFMGREDSVVAPVLDNSNFNWYTQSNFERALNRHFRILSITHSESARILYLCEKVDAAVGANMQNPSK